ncbi:MAG: GNAT family N-acetyltransferase [Gemmatimonadota bacterium]|nr:GNAT family N-acetyltransferase [Gemmatimonadota bacterium]MDH3422026.1 GNAT family N-acetyltransferase [Gemmatimonadota bacterium]
MTSFTIRPFAVDDMDTCLDIFDSNVPEFFRTDERAGYISFLEKLPGPYFLVLDTSGAVVGCGGYAILDGSDTSDLCWGMVRRDRHGTGAGRALTEFRIESIREDDRVNAIALSTSQHTSGFYERLGFRVVRAKRDGYAANLDRIDMRLEFRR